MRPTAPATDLPSASEHGWTLDALVERCRGLLASGQRRLVGIAGPPGSGKSTLTPLLAAAFGADAVVAPMDGFHLANAELVRLGRRDRKGAPDTFDAAGYVALLRRLRARTEEVVYAPEFDRRLEEPVAGALPLPATAPLVLTEGNYLLLDEEPWAQVRPLLDEVWYLEPDEQVRREWLVARHIAFGKDPEQAARWSDGPDAQNARRIAGTRGRADLVLHTPLPLR